MESSGTLPDLVTLAPAPAFADLQGLSTDLIHLWQVVGATTDEQQAAAEAVVAAACQAAAASLEAWKARRESLQKECQELEESIKQQVPKLVEGHFLQDLAKALGCPLQQQAAALRQLSQEVCQAVAVQERLKQGLAAACAALGMDLDVEGLSPEQLAAEVRRREQQLREEYLAALRALGLNPEDFPEGDLGAMAQRLIELQAQLHQLRQQALAHAQGARAIWSELKRSPELPRDAEAQDLADGPPAAVTAAVASKVLASLRAWEAQREVAAEEAERLHGLIRGHWAQPEAFLEQHGGIHEADLKACSRKLQQLREECRRAEAPLRRGLQQLYHKTGCDLELLESCYQEVEQATGAKQRLKLLEKETQRMEEYLESLRVILGQREELKALVVAGECFERAAQAGAGRWVGSSKHFLEEEKFRKRFIRQYPDLRDKLILSIEQWEGTHQKPFKHQGIALGDRLRDLRDHGVALASAKGDLSIMAVLLEALAMHKEKVPKSAAKGDRAGKLPHLPSPTSKGGMGRSSSDATMPKRSSSPTRKLKKQQSAASLTRLPPI